jgi:Thiamine pyrophosphate enzyme, C-terminal TPP binding domain
MRNRHRDQTGRLRALRFCPVGPGAPYEQQKAGIIPFGVDFKNPNFAKVAEAMGAKGIRIEEPGDVRKGLAEALAYNDGPVVVDAVVDPFELSLPSHTPFHAAKLHSEHSQAGTVQPHGLGD